MVMCGGSDGVVRIYSLEMIETDSESTAVIPERSGL